VESMQITSQKKVTTPNMFTNLQAPKKRNYKNLLQCNYQLKLKEEVGADIYAQRTLLVNKVIWCGCNNGKIAICDLKKRKVTTWFQAHDNRIYDMLAIGNHVWTCSEGCHIRIWDSKKHKLVKELQVHKGFVRAFLIVTNKDSKKHVWSADTEGTIFIWEKFKCVHTIQLKKDEPIICMAEDQQSENVWIGCYSYIRIIHSKTKQVIVSFKAFNGFVSDILVVDKEVWSCGDGQIIIWDKKTRDQITVCTGHKGKIYCLEPMLVNDEYHIWSGGFDKSIFIWHAKTKICLNKLDGHTDGVIDVYVSGGTVFTSSRDCTVRNWSYVT